MCDVYGRKFRNRELMQKHLKNHVKKIQRQQIAAAQQEDQENPALEEMNCSDTFISFENGNSDNKDLEVETITGSSDGNKDVILLRQVNSCILINVSEDVIENITENGSPDTSLNNVSEPLPICVDDYEEEEDEKVTMKKMTMT